MRVLVVEDEEVVARRLVRLIGRILVKETVRIDRASTLSAARTILRDRPPDLLFLDLNLEGRDGFRLLEDAVAGSFPTIVVSAHADQALRAFEYGVADFIAKPYDEARLRRAIEGLRVGRDRRHGLRYLAVRKPRGVRLVPIDEAVYLRGAGDYSEIHCRDGTEHLHHKTLTSLEALLPPPFERVHRSYIVNLADAVSLHARPGSRYFLRLRSGEEIPVSRSRVARLRSRVM